MGSLAVPGQLQRLPSLPDADQDYTGLFITVLDPLDTEV